MTEESGTGSGSATERAAADQRAVEREAAAAEERSALGETVPSVQDQYVARRLEQASAERLAAERREAVERAPADEEAEADSAVGVYLLLGVIVAALLLAIIWLSGTRQEMPLADTYRRPPAPSSSPAVGQRTSPPGRGAPPIGLSGRIPAASAPLPPIVTATEGLPGAPRGETTEQRPAPDTALPADPTPPLRRVPAQSGTRGAGGSVVP